MKMNVNIILNPFHNVLFTFHASVIFIYVLGEALDRIKTTFIVDKGIQYETETHYENIQVNQLHMTNFEKKVIPTTEKYCYTEPIENYNRACMAIKALYNSNMEYRSN